MLARWRTAALAALCALACAIPAVAAPAVPGCPGRDATGADAWTTVRPTIGGKTGAPIVDMAVLPLDPDVMYATDGKAVAMTRNGGCTWRDVAGPDSGLPAVASREIVAIDVSQRSTDGVTTVWLLSNVTVLGTARPEVLVAEDGDTIEPDAMQWALGGTPVGLPLGKAVTLAAGTDPETAYVLVSVPGVGRQLLVTQNRGELWEPRGGGGAGDARGVVVDSVYPNRLWTWGLTGLFYSADGGATMTPVEAVPGPVADVSVAQSPKGTRVLVLQPNGLLWRSDDGGETYTSTRVDVRTSTVAAVPVVDVAAAAGREVATVFPAIFTPYDVSPDGEVWFDDLAASLAGRDRVHVVGRTQDVLRVREVDVDLRFVPPTTPTVDLLGPVERIPLYPALNPRTSVVTLRPGETREVDYRLELPATPTPIDVHFVVDTTGSMGPVINALRLALAKIVNDLTAAGIEASFGVGDFRDVPQSPWGSSGDHVYKLLRGIGPVDDELEDALNALQAGGGGDGPEALQFAAYEAVRHAAGMPSHLESPQGDTGWRDGALRMAILATDTSSHNAGEPSGQGGALYPGPDYDQLVLALERSNVLVMGISAGSEARSSISEMAYDSGAVAPVAIDCNGDGRFDIPEGEPLVCPFTAGALSNSPVPTPIDPLLGDGAKNMSSAVLAMLRGVRDPAAVDVRSSRPDVARVLEGGFRVDRKSANALPVRVRYTCSAENYGTTIPVRLPAYSAGRQVSEAAAEVRCAAPPGVVRPVPPPVEEVVYPPAAPRPVPAAAAPPPPPPPAPVSQVNPNPNPHPNVNLQAGAAAEEQQMPQLAMALGDTEPAQEESLAMSRRDDTVPAAALLCAGVMMAGAAYGLQHRTRTAHARAHGPC